MVPPLAALLVPLLFLRNVDQLVILQVTILASPRIGCTSALLANWSGWLVGFGYTMESIFFLFSASSSPLIHERNSSFAPTSVWRTTLFGFDSLKRYKVEQLRKRRRRVIKIPYSAYKGIIILKSEFARVASFCISSFFLWKLSSKPRCKSAKCNSNAILHSSLLSAGDHPVISSGVDDGWIWRRW